MKRRIAAALALACILLSACSGAQQGETAVFSFSGENEQFAIFNGVVILADEREVFDGGDLKVVCEEEFSNIAFYSGTFYTMKNGERRTILSNSVADMTGGALNINGDLGRISGESCISGGKIENMEEFKNNLWFELNTTDRNGNKNTYQLELVLTEITGSANA